MTQRGAGPTVVELYTSPDEEKVIPLEGTIRDLRIVRREGAREVARSIKHYDFDAIISVGYRVC